MSRDETGRFCGLVAGNKAAGHASPALFAKQFPKRRLGSVGFGRGVGHPNSG